MEREKQPYNKGGHMSQYEPLNIHDMIFSPLAKQCFPNVGCMRFCEQVQTVKYHAKLTILFFANPKRDKVIISGMIFKISTEDIGRTTRIPNSGEKWFKILYLDVQNYKSFIKGHYKYAIKKVFPFGQLFDRFAPLMRVIMKYFIGEGRFYRLYK